MAKQEKLPVVPTSNPEINNPNTQEFEDEEWESEDEEDWEEMEYDEEEETEAFVRKICKFDPRQCVFCFKECSFENVEECLTHMEQAHSFFVPYIHLVADCGQLFSYLRELCFCFSIDPLVEHLNFKIK